MASWRGCWRRSIQSVFWEGPSLLFREPLHSMWVGGAAPPSHNGGQCRTQAPPLTLDTSSGLGQACDPRTSNETQSQDLVCGSFLTARIAGRGKGKTVWERGPKNSKQVTPGVHSSVFISPRLCWFLINPMQWHWTKFPLHKNLELDYCGFYTLASTGF
jgi:hypothetical protein